MADEDTRSLPAVAQTALRNQAVRAVLRGMTQAQAARVFGAHPNAVNRWIKRYQEGGFPGLGRLRGLQHGLVADQPRSEFEGRRFCRPRQQQLGPMAVQHGRGTVSVGASSWPAHLQRRRS